MNRGGLVLASALLAVGCRQNKDSSERGARLFAGEEALHGKIAGHEEWLPSEASRCVNCHASTGPDGGFGPTLDGAWLARPRSRRAGPKSAYDAASFCRLLRTGVDPVDIVITRDMPRYELTVGDCAALWIHLIEPRP